MNIGRTAPIKKRIIDFPSIEEPPFWPKADSSRVSLFEAVNFVGSSKFGEAWSGRELLTNYWSSRPDEDQTAAVSRAPAPIQGLGSRPRSIARVEKETVAGKPSDDHVKKRNMHFLAQVIMKRRADDLAEWESDLAALSRLTEAVDWLAQKCRDGIIPTFWRACSGGPLSELSQDTWYVEVPLQKFFVRGGFPKWFNGVKVDGYVFLGRAELEDSTALLAHVPATFNQVDLGRLSPFLRLAVQLAVGNDYTSRAKAETNPIREAQVRSAWAAALPGVPESKTVIQAIAKVLGFPDVEAIQRGQRGAEVKKASTRAKS